LPGLEIFSISILPRNTGDIIWVDQLHELIHGADHVSGQETQPLLLTPSQQIHHRYAYMYFDPGFPNYGQCQVFKCRKITLY